MMASGMDLVKLRQLVGSVVAGLTGHTHRELGEACTRLGLPEPPDEGSKRERVDHSFAALSDAYLPKVAERILDNALASAETRNAIQDELWANQGAPDIPKRTRREIARALDLFDLVYDADRFMSSWADCGCWTTRSTGSSAPKDVCAMASSDTCSATLATGLPRTCLSSSVRSLRGTRGLPGSSRAWSPPTTSLTSQHSGTLSTSSTRICVPSEPSCVKSASTRGIQCSASSRCRQRATDSRRTSFCLARQA